MDSLESATREEELLQEALSMSTGASVFFIVTPPGEGKKQEMERLSRLLSGWHILAVRLSPEQPLDPEALRGHLRTLQGDRRPMIWVEVEGLGVAEAEPARSAVAEQARQVLQDLNLKREALERLDAPILFWVTPMELRAFSVWAADLFATRTAIIGLERLRPTAKETLRIERLLTADRLRDALPPAEVEGRIRLYEGTLEAEARKRRPHLPRIASLHEELARLYAYRGDLLSALMHQREGQNAYRELAQQHPEVFLPSLARSLNDLSVMLSELGRREEALQVAQEAVGIYRRLAAQHPEAFLPYLASSLNNLGNRLSELGRREEALTAAQEAVELYRQLAAQHPQAFLPDLAMSLHNLGARLSELGRREEALQVAQEAVEIRRRLAAQHPEAFLPDLAMSLHNLGIRLSEVGRREEALQATQEAVEIRRRLAEENPPAFLPYLASSLNNLGDRLSEMGEPENALAAYEEAVRILLPFFRALPAAFADDMRYMLRDYLSACGRAKREPDWELVKETLRVGPSLVLSPTVVRLAPLLRAVAAVARGLAGPEEASAVEEALAAMRQQADGRALAEALRRLRAGERDPQALRRGLALDAIDEQALTLVEGAVADEEVWALLERLGKEALDAE